MQKRMAHLIGVMTLCIFVLTLGLIITIWAYPLLTVVISLQNLNQTVGLSTDRIMANYVVLLQYLNFPWIHRLEMPDFATSASAAFHFYQVKQLFEWVYLFFFLSFVGKEVYLRWLKHYDLTYWLRRPFKWLRFLPFFVVLSFFFGFDQLFIGFHKLLFNNNDWLFDPNTDPIINVLPEIFFFAAAILILLIFQSGMSWYYRKGKRAFYRHFNWRRTFFGWRPPISSDNNIEDKS